VPQHYGREGVDVDAAGPVSSAGLALQCPAPPRPEAGLSIDDDARGVGDAGDAKTDAPADARVGPALVFGADGSTATPPTLVADAAIPGETSGPPVLIQPPD
jgi:hypothetical protein